jgi:hypothetical protein
LVAAPEVTDVCRYCGRRSPSSIWSWKCVAAALGGLGARARLPRGRRHLLSCTNTTQIEAIADIEILPRKPVVNSNQAVLWGCLARLKSRLGPLPAMPELGTLMRRMDG